jgi:hypothetical protein
MEFVRSDGRYYPKKRRAVWTTFVCVCMCVFKTEEGKNNSREPIITHFLCTTEYMCGIGYENLATYVWSIDRWSDLMRYYHYCYC